MWRSCALLLVFTLLLGGCGSDDSEQSLSDSLTETIWISTGGKTIDFRDDGTFGVSVEDFVNVSEADREWGTWSIDGKVLSMVPDVESPACPGITGTYTVELVEDGARLDATVEDDACGVRRDDFSQGITRQGD